MSRIRWVLLVVAVVTAHLALLGWVPMGASHGEAVDASMLRLVTRVVPAPPPPPPPDPAPRPVAPKTRAAIAPARAPSAPSPAVATGSGTGAAEAPSPGDLQDTTAVVEAAASAPVAPPVPAAPPPPPIGLPASVRLKYNMGGESKGLVYHARAEMLWQQDGARYSGSMEVSAFLIGSRVQTSEGAIGAAGLEPDRFADKARRGEQAAHFDRIGKRIVFSANTPEAPLPPGTQDRLSVFLQLASQLAGDPGRYPEGTSISIPTAGARDLGDWTFVVMPPETLQLPIGTQPAVKLEREPRKDHDTRVEVWFAPALAYLPVRIRITQFGGDFIDQTLESAERP